MGARGSLGKSVLSFMCAFACTWLPAAAHAVHIPDPGLEAALRTALEKPDGELTEADLATLNSLDASGRDIRDLTGLEYCVNVMHLDLSDNLLTEVHSLPATASGLAELDLGRNCIHSFADLELGTYVYSLYLDSNELSSFDGFAPPDWLAVLNLAENHFTSLSGMPPMNLEELNLSNNRLASLAGLPALGSVDHTLIFNGNAITDTAGLENIAGEVRVGLAYNRIASTGALHLPPGLSRLSLAWNQLASLAGFPAVAALEVLDVSSNQLNSVEGLTGLGWLTELGVAGNQITSLAGLDAFPFLNRIDASSNRLTSLSDLAGVANLSSLDVSRNQLSSLAGLEGKTLFESLRAEMNNITSLAPLAGFTQLWELHINNNLITDLSPLAVAVNLKYLYVGNNPTGNIEPLLSGFPALTGLGVSEGQLSGISALTGFSNAWEVLSFEGSSFADLGSLAGLSALRSLAVRNAGITDLAPLAGLAALREIALPGNAVSNLDPLSGLTHLRALDVPANQVADLAALPRVRQLGFLNLAGNPLSDLSPLLDEAVWSRTTSPYELIAVWEAHPEWAALNICLPTLPLLNLTDTPAAGTDAAGVLRTQGIAVVADGELCPPPEASDDSGIHTADQNGDHHISLSELLRVIQFFNSDGYHCQPGSEDGYAPDSGPRTCAFHDSDYNLADWRVSLSEVLRLVQIFNSPGYARCACAEDGYLPLSD